MEANLTYKLLVPIASNVSCCQKKQKQKCPFRGLGTLSPPGRRCPSSPWRVAVAFLIAPAAFDQELLHSGSFFTSKLGNLISSCLFPSPRAQPAPQVGWSLGKTVQTAFSILLGARGQSFVRLSSLILSLHNWCQRETRRGNMTLF
uniref:Uncharacterized protein n=1 Tax=Pipistrellus kuhlii TaxID=59472 RepID=A0A7J7YAK3_PIPKU|nr:hypothetical protein mPipKuh1_010342 [Pipistrellus kuhlii]